MQKKSYFFRFQDELCVKQAENQAGEQTKLANVLHSGICTNVKNALKRKFEHFLDDYFSPWRRFFTIEYKLKTAQKQANPVSRETFHALKGLFLVVLRQANQPYLGWNFIIQGWN